MPSGVQWELQSQVHSEPTRPRADVRRSRHRGRARRECGDRTAAFRRRQDSRARARPGATGLAELLREGHVGDGAARGSSTGARPRPFPQERRSDTLIL